MSVYIDLFININEGLDWFLSKKKRLTSDIFNLLDYFNWSNESKSPKLAMDWSVFVFKSLVEK